MALIRLDLNGLWILLLVEICRFWYSIFPPLDVSEKHALRSILKMCIYCHADSTSVIDQGRLIADTIDA